MPAGPLAFQSSAHDSEVRSLDPEQVQYLAFAAAGVTGAALGELPYYRGTKVETDGGGGNILGSLVSRTAVSPDAAHCVSIFIIQDDGVTFLKRPQTLGREDLTSLGKLCARDEPAVAEIYELLAVNVSDHRPEVENYLPHTPRFNQWATNKPGTTLFLPVIDFSELYLSVLFGGLDEDAGYFLLDDRNNLVASGLRDFAISEGGHLNDDPAGNLVFPQDYLDMMVTMLATVELGAIMQNLSLMARALGVGGWPHYAATDWLEKLNFEFDELPSSRVLGLNPDLAMTLRLTDKDKSIKSFTRFSYGGENLIRPYCPPNFANMSDAVRAFVDERFGREDDPQVGRMRDKGNPSLWRDDPAVRKGIERYTDRQLGAGIEHAEYIHQRYGRFPARLGALTTLTAFQAHRLDAGFYETHYDAAHPVLSDVVR